MSTARPIHRAVARWATSLLLIALVASSVTASVLAAPAADSSAAPQAQPARADGPLADGDHSVTGFTYVEPAIQAPCPPPNVTGFLATYYTRGECIRIDFTITDTPTSQGETVTVRFIGPDGGAPFKTMSATRFGAADAGNWRVVFDTDTTISPALTWPAGQITLEVIVSGDTAPAGVGSFFLNQLGADVSAVPTGSGPYAPGDTIPLDGSIYELDDRSVTGTQKTGVPATFKIRVKDPVGSVVHTTPTLTAASNGDFPAVSIPGSATAGLSAGPETDFELTIELEVFGAAYSDAVSGAWASKLAGSGAVTLLDAPSTLLIENSFVSSVGWVKPGDTYPFRVFVRNFTDTARSNVQVTIPAPDGARFTDATALSGSGSVTIAAGGGSLIWAIGNLPAATTAGPSVATLVVEARAGTLTSHPEIVWKDLSSTATLTYNGGPGGLTSESHGPKVIPPGGDFETSRYGDKPFPMVPVDYRDRKHDAGNSGEVLSRAVNSEDAPGSTYNLYQEMSYGQLFPFGSVPSAGIASAGFDYAPGFEFSERDLTKPTCRGASVGNVEALYGTPAYPQRINDGWYQLPGDTEYYGGDFPAFTLGVGSTIDGACGDTSKSVYDAAVISDPEIDYNDFDSDKDGVVDFFMMVFVGLGGNGDSQINGTPPYDNVWPHSSSLEFSYQDETTGLQGYISDDQLKSLEGTPQCWTDDSYSTSDDCAGNGGSGQDDKPVYVRVGPYNVNPESAIDKSSVISHEYGHHLGLPDYYSTSYEAYADWNLMAADYSQHMTIFSKQELGWVVPTFLQPGETANVVNWEEMKNDTGQIRWQRPNGTFYTLSAANGDQNIHNGQAYALKLPRRQLIDPDKVATQASAPYVWWSGRGNDFGCTPTKGHNLDIVLPELEYVPDGTPITVTFKSSWDIEWDWDYGFTMVTTNGTDYTSLPSENGYTTQSAFNPNNAGCLTTHDNGLTGTSGSYQDGTQEIDRNPVAPDYSKGSPFLDDEYDLSAYAGERGVVLRFSYFTDPAFDRPGWFIDDIKVTAGSEVIYESDFSEEEELRIVPGGCAEGGRQTAANCTAGWDRIKSDVGAPFDHAYYLELRDRSGFDLNGRGESDRGDLQWAPGVLIEYTDEVRGFGNNGGGQPPRQHYLDSQPTPGADCGDGLLTPEVCEDAAFTAALGDSHFDDDPTDPEGDWVDNFNDDSSEDGRWHFAYGCLELDVTAMSGHTGNTEALPSDLSANATIRALAGCVPFDYTGTYPNAAPQAVANARPNPADAGDPVTFDGSGSTDDRQPAEDLVYDWDFTNDGTFDATGQVVTHTYPNPGQYIARLRVTDGGGLTDVTTIQVVVVATTAPDLKVSKVTFQNLSTPNGRRVRVTATIRNVGNAAAGASQTHFRHASQFIGLKATPAIPAGGSVQVKANWDARGLSGRHHVDITADHGKVVGESNEGNNRKTKGVDLKNGWVI
ncbi:MAG: immune inhibitor A [Chloroflexi bacterium]|nr:immune inhibitor A [Chloroflexota bacterium]